MNKVIDTNEKLAQFDALWTPHIIAKLNGQFVKLAKLKGDFMWHSHENEDELFMVLSGVLYLELKEQTVEIHPGQIYVVPRGIDHRPFTNGEEEVHVMLFEPSETKHTGAHITDRTVRDEIWI